MISKLQFEMVRLLNENNKYSNDDLAKLLFKDATLIEKEREKLINEQYIDELGVSKKGMQLLEDHRIDNAIILAAGMSTRFVPLSFEKPKGLLEVKGEVLIERQIKQLQEKQIKEIIVVVGHMKEKFQYLVKKYGVKLVEVNDYKKRNNYASVFAAKDYLKNTIVTSSDLYFAENIYQTYAYDAYYTAIYVSGKTAERGIITDQDDKIVQTMYGDKCYDTWVTLGYAFFNKRFSENFIKIVDEIYDLPETYGKFWADIQDDYMDKLYMYAKYCNSKTIYEFDSLEELRKFDPKYIDTSDSKIMHQVCYMLGVKESQIVNLESLKSISETMFKFNCKDDTYICDTKQNVEEKFFYQGRKYYMCRDVKKGYVTIYKMDKSIQFAGKQEYNIDKDVEQLYDYSRDFLEYHSRTLPLCAAENVISHFANLPLEYGFQERYIMNNTYSFNMSDNFIGCEKLLPFYQKIGEVCKNMFGAIYTDPRPFTGMHCIDMITKTICKQGDKMVILGKEHGGHASVKPVVERLGVRTYIAPFDMSKEDLDYQQLNELIEKEKINYILLAPSDIIRPFEVEKINTKNCVLMWDCSQLMGLIAAGLCNNPLKTMRNIIMFGGTHKTFPGPASGLIMTNEKYLHDMMETEINPKYLRHSQMHQKISLLFALVEFEKYGVDYMTHMVHCSNYLGEALKKHGFDIDSIDGQISHTHQVFIRCDQETMDTIYENAYRCEVTLNKKVKELFNGYGIRLGTQEIARYDWDDAALDIVAQIISLLAIKKVDVQKVVKLKQKLPGKVIKYSFTEDEIRRFVQLKNDIME